MTFAGVYRWPYLAAMGLLVVAAIADVGGMTQVRDEVADLAYVSLILGVAFTVPVYVRGPRSDEALPGDEGPAGSGLALALGRLRRRMVERLRRRPRT